MLRRCIGQHRESCYSFEQLLGSVTSPEFTDRGADAVLVAFKKGCVEIYFFPFFFAGGFFTAAPVVVEVLAMPSDSERLSSTSTVWVIASVPVGAGIAGAGAIVCVVCEPSGPPVLCR
jgi:hypothetical protein